MERYELCCTAVLKLLAFSAALSLVIFIIWRVLVQSWNHATDSRRESADGNIGCGCLGAILLFSLSSTCSYVKDFYFGIIDECLCNEAFDVVPISPENGTLVIFKKEQAMLYDHYMRLKNLIRDNNKERDSLDAELRTMKGERARSTIMKRIQQLEEDNMIYEGKMAEIDELSGRYYFARLMENLGLKMDQKELYAEIGIMKQSTDN